jgi:hypothetical protein
LEKSVGPVIWKGATNGCTDRLVSQLSDLPGLYAKNSHHWCEKLVGLIMKKSPLALGGTVVRRLKNFEELRI